MLILILGVIHMQINLDDKEELVIPKDTCPIPIMIERRKNGAENTAFIVHKSVIAQILLGKARKSTQTDEYGVTVRWIAAIGDILIVERMEEYQDWYLLSELSYMGSGTEALWGEQDIPNYEIIKVKMEGWPS